MGKDSLDHGHISTELVVIMNGRESVSWDESESATTVPFEKELLHYKVCAHRLVYLLARMLSSL